MADVGEVFCAVADFGWMVGVRVVVVMVVVAAEGGDGGLLSLDCKIFAFFAG